MLYRSIFLSFLLFLSFCFGFSYSAYFDFSEDSISLNDSLYSGDHYILSNKLNFSSDLLLGDLFYFGVIGVLNGNIDGQLNIFGGDIKMNSNINGDFRFVGGKLFVDGNIGGDLVFLGSEIFISNRSSISGGLYVFGQNASINGIVLGDLDLRTENSSLGATIYGDSVISSNNFTFATGAKIIGNLRYSLDNINKDVFSGIVLGNIIHDDIMNIFLTNKGDTGFFGFLKLINRNNFLFLFFIAFLLNRFFNKHIALFFVDIKNNFWKLFIFGLLFFILMPIIIFLLLISLILSPFGFFALAIYVFYFVFLKLIVVIYRSGYINSILLKYYNKNYKNYKNYYDLFIIIIFAFIVNVLSFVFSLILSFFIIGHIIYMFYNFIKNKKKI